MAPPPQEKRFTAVRPMLNQPPLNIENLPTRIQNGTCNVLPTKFCPPTAVGCPPTPCTPFCTPQCPQPCMPNCYFPSPCCPPAPPPMCCPPPCPPVLVCPPNYCTPYPCMPPPNCCPPPPCPPPPCQPCVPRCCTVAKPGCCAPKPACCNMGCGGGRSCCSGGPRQIVCIPKGTKPIVGCGGGDTAPRPARACAPPQPGGEQAASYNNCNFYLTDVPKGLRDRFGIMAGSGEDEETGEDTEECTEESSSCKDADDECCEEMANRGAGDDQCFHPPLGYPGSQRVPWGAGFPGMGTDPNATAGGFGGTNGAGYPNNGTAGGYGEGNGTAGGYGRGYPNNGRGNGTGGRNNQTGTGRGGRDNNGNRTPNTTAKSQRNVNDSRRGLQDNRNTKQSNYNTAKSTKKSSRNSETQTSRDVGVGAALKYPKGFREYLYTNDELTHKPEAYHAEKYDKPPPHFYDKRIHPLRAPISDYTQHRDDQDEEEGNQYEGDKGVYSKQHEHDYPSQQASTFRTGGTSQYPSRVPTGGNSSHAPPVPSGRSTRCPTANTSCIKHGQAYPSAYYSASGAGARTVGAANVYPSGNLSSYNSQGCRSKCQIGDANANPSGTYIGRSGLTSANSHYDMGNPSSQWNGGKSKCSVKPSSNWNDGKSGAHTHNPGSRWEDGKSTTYSQHPPHWNDGKSGAHTHNPGSRWEDGKSTTYSQHPPHWNDGKSGAHTHNPGSRWEDGKSNPALTNNNVGTSRPMTNVHGQQSVGYRHSEPLGDEDENLIPVYKASTQTRLQIIERPNEPSEVRVIQRPVQEIIGYRKPDANGNQSHIKLDVYTEDMRKQRKKKPDDPCHPKGCFIPHTRRLRRLCSFSNKRNKRLSQLHKPTLHFRAPACPIRETVASILRKQPPANCRWHEKTIPAYHEFCMTDRNPGTNRYPLLTKENMLNAEKENCGKPSKPKRNSKSRDGHGTHVEQRGVKRKLHHR